jgi:hypothetical protein
VPAWLAARIAAGTLPSKPSCAPIAGNFMMQWLNSKRHDKMEIIQKLRRDSPFY